MEHRQTGRRTALLRKAPPPKARRARPASKNPTAAVITEITGKTGDLPRIPGEIIEKKQILPAVEWENPVE